MSGGANRARWVIVAMVFVAIMLNYVDRQILALLKPTLEAEFRWSDQDYANMGTAFQVATAFAFLGTGWFIDRVGLRRGFGVGVGVWSLAGMAHAVATTVTGFIGARVVLGMAESIGTPAAVKTAATIAAMAPLAVIANKEMVNAAYETTLSAGVQFERRLFNGLFGTADQKEGMAAFVEKCAGQWTGK